MIEGLLLGVRLIFGRVKSSSTILGSNRKKRRSMIPCICILLISIRLTSSQTAGTSGSGTMSLENGLIYGPTIRYSYTGTLQPYVVPAGVYAISVSLAGGCGWYNGGRGNILNATIVTSPFDTLYVSVAGGSSALNGTTVIGGGGAGWGPTTTGGRWLYQFHPFVLYLSYLSFGFFVLL